MRWMLECDCADWDWMVLTLDYQLSFPTSMYEQHYIDSTLILSQMGLLRIPRIRYWLIGQGTLNPLIL